MLHADCCQNERTRFISASVELECQQVRVRGCVAAHVAKPVLDSFEPLLAQTMRMCARRTDVHMIET